MTSARPGGSASLSAEDIARIAEPGAAAARGRGARTAGAGAASRRSGWRSSSTTRCSSRRRRAADIERLCDEARRHGFFSVCVNPSYVAQAATLLRGSPVKVCCVVGFPLGAQPPEIKALEARRAIREGAHEIDMVDQHRRAQGPRRRRSCSRTSARVVEACQDGRAVSKVILETALLTDEEKVRGCELSMKAGADFVKTSTGLRPAAARRSRTSR